jgi:hypothetical protein
MSDMNGCMLTSILLMIVVFDNPFKKFFAVRNNSIYLEYTAGVNKRHERSTVNLTSFMTAHQSVSWVIATSASGF